jgi:hypothetical protein
MIDTLEFENFEQSWLKMERDLHAQVLRELKKEIAGERMERDRRVGVRSVVKR